MTYPAYPEYRDSGVEWLKDIPEHWKVKKLKYLIRNLESGVSVNATDMPAEDGEIGVLKTSCVYTGKFRSKENKTVFEEEKNRVKCPVRKDEIIISRMNTPDLVGASAWVQDDFGNLYLPDRLWQTVFFNNSEQSSKFISYFMMVEGFRDEISNYAEGASSSMQNIAKEDYLSIPVLLPAIEEQTQIATFLDRETQKIDRLIEKQQQLIKLLQEKRQAVISHAVTKGLNPNVTNSSGTNLNATGGPKGEGRDSPSKMKDSGVEWLGEVPEHWEMVPLKHLCTFSGGGTPSKENLFYWVGGDIPWVSPKDMKTFWLSDTQDKLTPEAVNKSATNYVVSGALLMVVRSGILQKTIPIAINTVTVTLNQDMKALRFNERMNVEYAANYIKGHTNILLLEWSKEGATVESIEQEYLSAGLTPVPPIHEQIEINLYLKNKTSVLQSLIDKA